MSLKAYTTGSKLFKQCLNETYQRYSCFHTNNWDIFHTKSFIKLDKHNVWNVFSSERHSTSTWALINRPSHGTDVTGIPKNFSTWQSDDGIQNLYRTSSGIVPWVNVLRFLFKSAEWNRFDQPQECAVDCRPKCESWSSSSSLSLSCDFPFTGRRVTGQFIS